MGVNKPNFSRAILVYHVQICLATHCQAAGSVTHPAPEQTKLMRTPIWSLWITSHSARSACAWGIIELSFNETEQSEPVRVTHFKRLNYGRCCFFTRTACNLFCLRIPDLTPSAFFSIHASTCMIFITYSCQCLDAGRPSKSAAAYLRRVNGVLNCRTVPYRHVHETLLNASLNNNRTWTRHWYGTSWHRNFRCLLLFTHIFYCYFITAILLLLLLYLQLIISYSSFLSLALHHRSRIHLLHCK